MKTTLTDTVAKALRKWLIGRFLSIEIYCRLYCRLSHVRPNTPKAPRKQLCQMFTARKPGVWSRKHCESTCLRKHHVSIMKYQTRFEHRQCLEGLQMLCIACAWSLPVVLKSFKSPESKPNTITFCFEAFANFGLRSPQLYKQMAMSADMPGAFEASAAVPTDTPWGSCGILALHISPYLSICNG